MSKEDELKTEPDEKPESKKKEQDKSNKEKTDNVVAFDHNSSRDYDKAVEFAERVVNLEIENEGIMNEAKKKCAPQRDDIKEIKNEAANAGYGKKAFNAMLAELRLKRKIAAIPGNMEDEHAAEFAQLSFAWIKKHDDGE